MEIVLKSAVFQPFRGLTLYKYFATKKKKILHTPSDPDFETLSLPAKSTRFSFPSTRVPVRVLLPSTVMVKTECERLDLSFIAVEATLRFEWPSENILLTSSNFNTLN